MPLYEEKYICPFAIRFSQARIRPTFQDGRVVEKTKEEIQIVPWPLADGDYDILLDAPFPPIEIMRWRPKYRSEDGSAFETGRGDAVLADSCWCTFDNRRLYCLQAAAVEQWPRRAAAVVHIMHNLPEGRSVLRKFRTTDLGTSVKISRRNDSVPRSVWHWPDLAVGASAPRSLEERRAVDRAAADAAKESWAELVDVPSNAILPKRAAPRGSTALERFELAAGASSALERFELAESMAAELDCTEDSTTVTTTASGSGSPAMVSKAASAAAFGEVVVPPSSGTATTVSSWPPPPQDAAADVGTGVKGHKSSQQPTLAAAIANSQQQPQPKRTDGVVLRSSASAAQPRGLSSALQLHPPHVMPGAAAAKGQSATGLGVFVSHTDDALFEADEDDTGCEQQ